MDKKNQGNQEQNQPSSSAQSTTPVNQRSGDKLRENPANDEETIAQNPRKFEGQSTEQSPLSKDHDEDERNKVTNEDDQKEIVNPSGGSWDKKVD